MARRTRQALKLVAAAAAVLLAFAAARRWGSRDSLEALLAWVQALGPWGPAAFVAAYVLACLALLPASWLTLGAGAVFGTARGAAYVSVGATLGAAAAFLVGRHLARAWVARLVSEDKRWKALDEAVAREGWKIVLLTRLSPLFPFVLMNYAFGLTRIGLKPYALATWVGMIPGVWLYVSLGALAGDLARLGAGSPTRTPAQWALGAFGLAATLAVTLYVARLANAALKSAKRP